MARMFRWALALAAMAPGAAGGQERAVAPCGDGHAPAVMAHVTGLKNGIGTLRLQAYGPDPATFLQKHRWLRRVEVRVEGRRALDVCVPLPAPGRYAFAARHDANANGRSDWNDGGGFSRNPHLSLFRLKPGWDEVALPVAAGLTRVAITMQYRQGLSVGPVAER